MKARNRKTGEVVEIISYSGRVDRDDVLDYVNYIDSNGKEHTEDGRGLNFYWDFEPVEQEHSISENKVDWPSFRREAAKDILCALIGHKDSGVGTFSFDSNAKVENAIAIADRLINRLKQE